MKLILRKALLPMLLAVGMVGTADAQNDGKKTKDGFTVLPSGIEYKIIKHGDGKKRAAVGDHMELYIHVYMDDSLTFDSRKMFSATSPVPVKIAPTKYEGDMMEGFMLLVAGDSAVFHVPMDLMRKAGNVPPQSKLGEVEMMIYEIQAVSVRTEEEEAKYQAAQTAKQGAIDEKLLKKYFSKNKIKATKTESGLYYTVSNKGTGEKAKAGQKLTVNYTGMLLDGTVFDSNTDSAFKHPTPFSVVIGKGNVIKGWDEGMLLFSKGGKGKLYIPSTLAYGAQDRSPQIPPNSILIFEVELLDIEDAPAVAGNQPQLAPAEQAKIDDKLIQDYLKKNDIKATKTESGLYYSISQKGLGDNAAKGKKVSMNYTGYTLDGTVFDSNIDPKFKHVQPFEFPLGAGRVIRGWDEGVQLLNIGSKATFFIPSGLAYGPQSPAPAIKPNSVLIFDVELVSIQ